MNMSRCLSCVAFLLAVASVRAGNKLEERLRTAIVDRVAFQDARLEDVLSFFRTHGRKLTGDKEPVNIVLLGSERATRDMTLTMEMDSIPLYEALRYTSQACGLTMTVEPNAVVFTSPAREAMSVDVRVTPAKEAHQYTVEFQFKANGDVLSAPRMVTLAGQEAKIQIGTDDSPGIVGTALITEHADGGGTAHTTLRQFDERGKLKLSVVQDISIGPPAGE